MKANKIIKSILSVIGKRCGAEAETVIVSDPHDTVRGRNELKQGDTVRGKVILVKQQYALVECAGRVCKLDRMRYAPNAGDLREEVAVGDELDVVVHKVVSETCVLLRKAGFSAEEISSGIAPGSRVKGIVRKLKGAFALVELENGLLAGVSRFELTWGGAPSDVREILHLGDEAVYEVISIDPGTRRIYLSLRRANGNPWDQIAKDYPTGTMITGRVIANKSIGVFVEIAPGLRGLIHTESMRCTRPFAVGANLRVVILHVNAENGHIHLGCAGYAVAA